jgi:hypothetical protein
MGLRRNSITTTSTERPESLSASHISHASHFWPLKRRSGLELAGVLLVICLLVVVAGTVEASENHHSGGTSASSQSHKNASLNLQVTHTAASAPSQPSDQAIPSDTTGASPSASSSSISSNISSTSANGTTSTQVTINGQPVTLPTNGNSQSMLVRPEHSPAPIQLTIPILQTLI